MINDKTIEIGSNNQIHGNVTQQIGNNTYNDFSININAINQLPHNRKTSIIQEILEGILDLGIDLQPIVLDTKDYTIRDKIDYNKINCYDTAFDFLMRDSQLIEQRLNSLNNHKDPMSSQRLYSFVQRIYIKYCGQSDPDQRILYICDEIKNDLMKYPNISDEDTALIPVIVFYVFSKCYIFDKPPIPI